MHYKAIKVEITQPIPYTNQNFYEIVWAARLEVFRQALEGGAKTPFDIMACLVNLEQQFTFGVEKLPSPTGDGTLYLNGVVRLVPNPDSNQQSLSAPSYSFNQILAAVVQHCDDGVKAIVELGAGYGRNLMELRHHLRRPDLALIGAEYTQSGRDAMEFFNASFPDLTPIQTVFTDHRLASFPFISSKDKVLVFSCHSLEQVEKLPLDFFVNLADSSEDITGVHIEPFGFQAVPRSAWSDVHHAHNAFIRLKDYNLNMWACLEHAVREQAITITGVALNASFAQPENPSSVVVWKKRTA
ncbi:hypothetical protein HEQ62_02845 [Haematospirillum jordaniae]|uniref:Methyltransferase domain-containing protein n=1 Tax=Haematospirillum jordaniae TaxID=1549855 RepID=A0A143DE37_9PROT|nr:hypothetical protein [Haematospirillum jordaniae]AMW34985.1 hypothetical protein AY555_07125 [Haematospirillum jordaniae]NKD44285.1 hypothetical protein [Haematospirillum jordaniae]NKD56664.1 hypothetical protein [Haematospirillum jordaniae]NKD58722.1 hypothetical protein [Haematospirillum jordaniae]NKD66109.1 hypothetical protein [Haematospirillum jordaniae]